jgi:hypothetical protein
MASHPHDVQPFDMVVSQKKVPYIVYAFASMMLPGALHYQGRLKGRVVHVLFA